MKVPIISTSMVKFGDIFEKGLRELIKEAGTKALHNANLNGGDIDLAIISNVFALKTSNSSVLGSIVFEELGIKNSICVSNGDASGAIAIQEAANAIKNGAKTVLVLGAEKVSDFKVNEIYEMSNSMVGEPGSGSYVFADFALITNKYLHDYKLDNHYLSMVPISAHKNAMANEFSQFKSELTEGKIASSPYLAEPLRLMECASYCDGASSLVMCNEEVSKKHKIHGYFVNGKTSNDSLSLAKRKSIVEVESSKDCVSVFNHSKMSDIKVMEMYDITPISLIIGLEDLGFAKKGHGLDYFKENQYKINQSGGLKACGHSAGATGIRQAIDVLNRLKKGEFGLTHTMSGNGSVSSVNIFEGKNA